MVEETIHVMNANETSSEAFMNYAGAAFLVGMAVFAIGMGAGMITQSIRNLRKDPSPSNFSEDLLAELRKKRPSGESPRNSQTPIDAIVNLKKTVEDILSRNSQVIDQVSSATESLYYVSKNYKEPITVGSMIPENFVVKKPEGMTIDAFMRKDQVKFKSKTVTNIKGGMTLVVVEEIVNSEPVKPV